MDIKQLTEFVKYQAEMVQKWAADQHLREAFYYQGQGAINCALLYCGVDPKEIEALEKWYQQNAGVIVFPWLENEVS